MHNVELFRSHNVSIWQQYEIYWMALGQKHFTFNDNSVTILETTLKPNLKLILHIHYRCIKINLFSELYSTKLCNVEPQSCNITPQTKLVCLWNIAPASLFAHISHVVTQELFGVAITEQGQLTTCVCMAGGAIRLTLHHTAARGLQLAQNRGIYLPLANECLRCVIVLSQ